MEPQTDYERGFRDAYRQGYQQGREDCRADAAREIEHLGIVTDSRSVESKATAALVRTLEHQARAAEQQVAFRPGLAPFAGH